MCTLNHVSLFDDRVQPVVVYTTIPPTVLPTTTSGEPGPDKPLRLRRYDGSVQRLSRVATRQLELCISIACDLPLAVPARTPVHIACCLLAFLPCTPRATTHTLAKGHGRPIDRFIGPQPQSLSSLLCPSSSLLAVSTNMRAGF